MLPIWFVQRNLPTFRTKLDALAQEHAGIGITYELSGPWPPHHFLQLDLDAAEG